MSAEPIKRKTLGRGLDALFGDQVEPAADAAAAAAPGKLLATIAIDLLSPSPLQPRRHFDAAAIDELAASIREKGVLQPLLVRPASTPGRFEIIAGERRWRAAQRAQLHEVPAIVRELDDAQVLEIALIENLQRQDLSPAEEARGYKRLVDEFHHTQEQIAEIVGKSRAHVANTLRLLSLPSAVLDMLDQGKLNAGQARPLIGARNADALAEQIARRGLSARQVERLVKQVAGKRARATTVRDTDADTRALEQSLEQATGYKTSIRFDGHGGTLTVAYANLEQLDDIVRRLSSGGRRPKSEIGSKAPAGRFPEGHDPDLSFDHDTPYPDPGVGDVGAAGALGRGPARPPAASDSDFGIAARIDETHASRDHWNEDHSLEPASDEARPDPAEDDVGADGAIHR
ncbi:MAG: ParB/RepB/Spo0J family partition protein [Rhodospirillaceae bacterium]|nr:ParB/RepB/Spo0J family partition protein [Rhodospirillaceae bacterium]